MAVMHYKGYNAHIDFDEEDEVFIGHVAGVCDVVGFHGGSVGELKAAFRKAVEDYERACAKAGKPPQRPYSDTLLIRISPEAHRRAAIAAELAGQSLDEWAEQALDAAAEELVTE